MEKYLQRQTQPYLSQHQEEPPAANLVPWNPPFPAELEGKQGWENESLGHRGLPVGKAANVGLMEER